MKILNIYSDSEQYTKKIANTLAKLLQKGDIIILTGELGSGKTKFTEGFLCNFNLQNEISSPTFNIVNEYQYNDLKIYHFDVYRLSNIDEFYEIGGDEYFSNGICLIEWGEQIHDALPNNYIQISFKKDYTNDNTRLLRLEAFGEKYDNILEILKEELV